MKPKKTAMDLCRKMMAMIDEKQAELRRRQRELDKQMERLLGKCPMSVEEREDRLAKELGLNVSRVGIKLRRDK